METAPSLRITFSLPSGASPADLIKKHSAEIHELTGGNMSAIGGQGGETHLVVDGASPDSLPLVRTKIEDILGTSVLNVTQTATYQSGGEQNQWERA